ncbi:MAG: pyruvate formate-lyase-activating protein [Saccharofermentans sp.]|nr:pyruvate formate-lyase-activating protein [Saccharofermentans sp.]
MTKGFIHSTESFGAADGPGVRYIIFFSGCAMRCQYCHNPDTWHMNTGKEMDADELLNQALRYKEYWGPKGGITVSGGEPLLQIDFLTELFAKAKEKGIHTTVDTSGNPYTKSEPWHSKFMELMKVTDLVMLDLKHIDNEKHKGLTGQPNTNILEMAQELSDMGKPMWIRHVLVPERTDYDEDLNKLSEFIKTLKTVERVEVLPYHTLGIHKWETLGIENILENDGIKTPTKDRVENAKKILGAVQ